MVGTIQIAIAVYVWSCSIPPYCYAPIPSYIIYPSYHFDITLASPLLSNAQQAKLHSNAAKILFISYRTRPDVLTAISFLTKRVLTPLTQKSTYSTNSADF